MERKVQQETGKEPPKALWTTAAATATRSHHHERNKPCGQYHCFLIKWIVLDNNNNNTEVDKNKEWIKALQKIQLMTQGEKNQNHHGCSAGDAEEVADHDW